MSQQQFDLVRAMFFLIAALIAAHVIVALGSMGACIYYGGEEVIDGTAKCDADGRITHLLTSSLAAALAFVAGRATKPDRGGP